MDEDLDHIRMQAALEEARAAALRDEVPVGAVLVDSRTGEIVAHAGNRTIEHADPTSHAEIQVIRDICAKTGAQRIPEYDLYVTLEPCPMCAAAISYARIRRLVFGATDPKSGGIHLYTLPQMHHKPEITAGILAEDCASLLKNFFAKKRT
jgi:tRNA(Arg) A34 adenosine deaminase TadA